MFFISIVYSIVFYVPIVVKYLLLSIVFYVLCSMCCVYIFCISYCVFYCVLMWLCIVFSIVFLYCVLYGYFFILCLWFCILCSLVVNSFLNSNGKINIQVRWLQLYLLNQLLIRIQSHTWCFLFPPNQSKQLRYKTWCRWSPVLYMIVVLQTNLPHVIPWSEASCRVIRFHSTVLKMPLEVHQQNRY